MSTLSRWAAAGRHAAMGQAGTDTVAQLAIALGAIRSVVRVIDTHRPAMDVDWATTEKSYTDFASGEIRVNPAAILDDTTSREDALDVSIAFGMHEAGHGDESRDIYESLIVRTDVTDPAERKSLMADERTIFNPATGNPTREDFAFHPTRVAAYLWNVVEDSRMERAEARKWPGFAPYFEKLLYWLWSSLEKRDKVPQGYGNSLEERLSFVFVVCRFPDHAAELFNRGMFARSKRELKWWDEWHRSYRDGVNDAHTTIQMALDHLIEDSPEAEKEMQELITQEEQVRAAMSSLRDAIRELLNRIFENVPETCTGGAGEPEDQALDGEVSEQVDQMVREGLTESASPVATRGHAASTILSRKPEETERSRRAFVGRPDAQSEALRAALVFRASDPEWTEKLLKSGEIDDEELHRWAADDYRVFSNKVVESKPDVLMGLLVDMSGSMSGKKLNIAQRLAQLFVYALQDSPGVETRVWGHTADDHDRRTTEVFTLWEPGDPMSRLGLIQELPHANNADGHAIAWCADQMRGAIQPQKVLFVLSDGLPSAYEYGYDEGEQHVAESCRWARMHGVEVIQIAIDPYDLRPANQERMFGTGNWIPFESEQALPRQLAGLMGRFA